MKRLVGPDYSFRGHAPACRGHTHMCACVRAASDDNTDTGDAACRGCAWRVWWWRRRVQVYGVLPAATMFMVFYSKISTLFTKDQLFYVRITPSPRRHPCCVTRGIMHAPMSRFEGSGCTERDTSMTATHPTQEKRP